jgi:hypothetical protein
VQLIFFFFNRHYNPGWVSACSTVVEHSQQEGFTECRCQRHVKLPAWRRTSDLERYKFRHKRSPASEATLANPAAEGGTMGEKWPRILPKVTTFTSLLATYIRILKIKANEMHYFSTFFGIELYIFRTDLLSIIRSLNTVFTEIGICHTSNVTVC